MLTGLIRNQLTAHFASELTIEEPDLRQHIWRENELTGILIESIHRWRGDLVEKRPAVIVKRNGRHNLRLTIGDKAGTTERGFQKYQTHWLGSHTLFCIHGSGAGVEVLSTEVQRELTQFAPVLVGNLPGLERFQVTEVGGIAEMEEAQETFVVPVTVGWAYSETWELQLESRILSKIPLSVLLDGAVFQEKI